MSRPQEPVEVVVFNPDTKAGRAVMANIVTEKFEQMEQVLRAGMEVVSALHRLRTKIVSHGDVTAQELVDTCNLVTEMTTRLAEYQVDFGWRMSTIHNAYQILGNPPPPAGPAAQKGEDRGKDTSKGQGPRWPDTAA